MQKKSFPIWFLIATHVSQKGDVFIVLDWFLFQSMTLIRGFGVSATKWYENPYRKALLF